MREGGLVVCTLGCDQGGVDSAGALGWGLLSAIKQFQSETADLEERKKLSCEK